MTLNDGYAVQQIIDRREDDPRYEDEMWRRMKHELCRGIVDGLEPDKPVTLQLSKLRDVDYRGNTLLMYRLLARPVQMLEQRMYVMDEPDYRVPVRKPAPKPKPAITERIRSWWKEMQKPMPYDGGYA